MVKQIRELRLPTGKNKWGEDIIMGYCEIAKKLNLSSCTVWRACTKNFCPTCGHRI